NLTMRAQKAGISAVGANTGVLICTDNTSLDNNQEQGSGASAATSINAANFATVVYRNNTVGGEDQVRADTITNVTTLHEIDNIILGSMVALGRSSITTRLFRGTGSGAPSFTAAIGCEYRRLDGGASTTMYINETGTNTWR